MTREATPPRPIIWHRLRLGFVVGALAGVAALLVLSPQLVPLQGWAEARLPAGWQFIPDPGAVLALSVQGGTLWVGSKQGLFELDTSDGRCRGKVAFDPPVNHVRSLLVDAHDTLWVGHLDGLVRKAGSTVRSYGKDDGLPAKRVDALALGSDGMPWIGTPRGLMRVAGEQLVTAPESARLLTPIISALMVGADGTLWVGSASTADGGVTVLSGDRACIQTFAADDGLPHPFIDGFMADRDGTVWAASGQFERGGGCVFARTDTTWRIARTVTRTTAGIPEDHVRSILRDAAGDLWVGFENEGLAVLTRHGVKRLGPKDGFPSREVTCMLQQPDGVLWLGTLAGVIRVDEAAAARFKLN